MLNDASEAPRGGNGRAPDPLRVGGWMPMREYADADAVDFAIVGTGAGGGTLACKLAEHGFSVVAFDAGPWWRPLEDFASGVAAPDKQAFSQVARGRELTAAGDCIACHSDPAQGRPFAGGFRLETPFGTLLGANLTPDRETGIGAWTDNEFVDALQKGVGRGGRHLYPAMPYNYYTKITREDALAIRAYLASSRVRLRRR
jgi:hypothetical protein